jgi:hypothetical protein
MFLNPNPWLSFVLKAFDFNLGAKFFSKRTLFSQRGLQLIYKQNPGEKILFVILPEILAKPKLTFQI